MIPTPRVTLAVVLALLLPAPAAFSYSNKVHTQTSVAATAQSVLGVEPDLMADLGVPADVAPSLAHVAELIAEGSIAEDSTFPLVRVSHHFYDPLHSRALHPCIAICLPPFCGFTPPICHQSPTWAVEDTEDIGSQAFSFRHARERMRDALTKPARDARATNWRATFRALGHIIHHLEDMAQPQHTRNDFHIFSRLWENYAEDRADDNPRPPLCTYPSVVPAPLAYPQTRTRAFWSTGSTRAGLAQFSNENFVTDDTNFRGSLAQLTNDPEFALPSAGEAHIEARTIAELRGAGENIPAGAPDGTLYLISTPVRDFYASDCAPAETWTSTYSIYTPDLDQANQPQQFALNRVNMDHGYAILLPRAIGYSAGLINHFFRARIDFVPAPDQVGHYLLRNVGSERLFGNFSVYYDDENGERHQVPAAVWNNRSLAANGGQETVEFAATSVPADDFVVVFEGTVGEADAAEFPVTTAKVVHGGHGFVTPGGRLTFDGSAWRTRQETLRYGNANWYGNAGILSWVGPWGRYLNPRPVGELSRVIFQDGSPRFVAPGPVIGAALRTDSTATPPRTYVTAIVAVTDGSGSALGETAYSAPVDVLQQDPGAWGPAIATPYMYADPQGGDGLPIVTAKPAHYYFNASGTEAQSVKGEGEQVQLHFGTFAFRRVVFSVGGGFAVQPLEANAPIDSHHTTTSFDGCCAPSDQFHPDVTVCTYLGSSSHDDFTDTKRWTIAADYRGDQAVFAVRESHDTFTGDSTEDAGTNSSSGAGSGSEQVVIGGVTLETRTYSLTQSAHSVGLHDCDPDDCFFFFDGACHYLATNFSEQSDVAQDEKRIEFLDLRSADPLIVFRKVHFTQHHVFNQGAGGEETVVNQETPMWHVGGAEVALGPTRDGLEPIGPQVTASTDPLGHAILDWPDFALSRLSPPGDPRALTGYSTPVGLF